MAFEPQYADALPCPDAMICLFARMAIELPFKSAPFQDGSAPSPPDLIHSNISFLPVTYITPHMQ
jgi:hypothetical protein